MKYPENVLEKMQEIVEKCMGDAPPYCEAACPMHTDAKGYINLIAEGKNAEAIAKVRERLFLPGTLGRICAHPCEEKCKRGDLQHPMSIMELKRFAANFDDPAKWDLSAEPPRKEKIAVVGAGPAGGQAALYLRKKGYGVTVFERLPMAGGMLVVGIPEYRLPRDIVRSEYSYLEKLGVEFRFNIEVGRDISFHSLREEYDAVLLAAGAHKSIVLPLPGAELKGVFGAGEFLREVSLTKKFEIGKRVVVIGGGNVAMDVARTLRRIGATDVKTFCLEHRDQMPAHEWEVLEAEEEGVSVNCSWGPAEILGDDGKVSGVRFQPCLQVFDEQGRFAPRCDPSRHFDVEADAVVMAVGLTADSAFVPAESGVEKERSGRFKVDPLTLETSVAGVFAAGDAAIRPWLAIEAMAQGEKAAVSIHRFLQGEDMREGRDFEGAYETWLEKDVEGEEILPRVATRMLPPEERVKGFDEVNLGFDEEMAKKEASRCFQCECKECMKECLMLNDFCECPKELFEEILQSGEVDPLIPYSCNMCNQCTLECPREFKLSDRFFDIRKEMVKAGTGPLKGHNPIHIHQKLGFSPVFNVSVPDTKAGFTKRVFFPGCSLPSYNPEAVGQVLEFLQEKLPGTGAVLKCCGKPTKAMGMMDAFHDRFKDAVEEIEKLGADEIVVACQSCYSTFKQYCPDKKVVSLWDLFRETGVPGMSKGIGKDSGITVAVHDSCVTRDVPEIHDGVRYVLSELGYEVEELPHTRENTRCCGFGGMIVPVNPDLAKRVMDRRAQEAESEHVVTYCAACRASMVAGGKKGLHLLDLVFGGSWKGRETPPADGALASWIKRWKTKQILKKIGKKR